MMYIAASLLAAFLLPCAIEGIYSYDPSMSNGPANWSLVEIPGKTNECGGSSQSGIDIPTGACDKTNSNYTFEPGTCTLNDVSYTINDHVVELDWNTSSGCTPPQMLIPGFDNAWVALQFHIHAGSDHALDGANFGADMHVVHKEVNSDRLAVLGLFLDPTSPEGGQFADVIPGWKKVKAATLLNCTATNKTSTTTTQSLGNRSRHLGKNGRTLQKSFNPYALIPKGATFYNYQGSLTTPPCTQGVTWNVVDTPVSISVREYDDLINLILDYVNPKTCAPGTVASPSGYTSRPVQPLNNRTITHICPTGTETSQTQKKANTTAKTTTSGGSVPSYKLGLAATLSVVVAGLFW